MNESIASIQKTIIENQPSVKLTEQDPEQIAYIKSILYTPIDQLIDELPATRMFPKGAKRQPFPTLYHLLKSYGP